MTKLLYRFLRMRNTARAARGGPSSLGKHFLRRRLYGLVNRLLR